MVALALAAWRPQVKGLPWSLVPASLYVLPLVGMSQP